MRDVSDQSKDEANLERMYKVKNKNLANHLGYILGLSGPNPLAVGENENEGAKKQASEKRSEKVPRYQHSNAMNSKTKHEQMTELMKELIKN